MTWLLNLVDVAGKVAQWHLKLIEYDFEVINSAGVKKWAAVAISPLSINGADDNDINDETSVLANQR